MKIADSYGHRTGVQSAFEKTYAPRLSLYDTNVNTTSNNNSGNDFIQFEKMHTAILNRQNKDMLINLFQYNKMPPTLNTAQLETMLRRMGGGVCVGHDDLGDLVILGQADGLGYNVYGNVVPSLFDGSNSYMSNKKMITNRNLKGDYVVFYNKQSYEDFYSTDFEIIEHYSALLATIKATERMNIIQMRVPYLYKGKKNSVVGNDVQAAYLSGDIFISVDENSDLENKLSKIDLRVDDRTSSLQMAYRNTFNEMLTLFGIYNNSEQKKERLTQGESSANNHVIEGMGDIYLNARRHAVDLLNSAFGYEIEVSWNSAVATMFRDLAKR